MPVSKLEQHADVIRGLVAQGRSDRQIGERLSVGPDAVRKFRARHKIPQPTPTATLTPEPAEGEVSREEMLKARVKELTAALTKNTRAAVVEQRIVDAIRDAVANVAPPEQVWMTTPSTSTTTDAHHRQVVLLSDFHGGEVVDPDALNGVNSYNWEIQAQRIDETIHALLSHKRHSPALSGLDVLFLGDMCSGSNHDEIVETNEFPAAEQGVKMGYLLGTIVERLLPHYPDVRVGAVVGNHPRMNRAPAAKQVFNNYDWVAYKLAETYTADLPVTWDIARGNALFWEVAGRRAYVFHGDGIRSSMPGIPWGGVVRRTNQIQAQYNHRIDHYWFGHFHSANVLEGGRVIGNGALKGTDEWVSKQYGGGSPPTQVLLTFDERKQRLTDVKLITPTAGLGS